MKLNNKKLTLMDVWSAEPSVDDFQTFSYNKIFQLPPTSEAVLCGSKDNIRIGFVRAANGVKRQLMIGYQSWESGNYFTDWGTPDWSSEQAPSHSIRFTLSRDGKPILTKDLNARTGNITWYYFPISEAGRYRVGIENLASGECQGSCGVNQSGCWYSLWFHFTLTQADLDLRDAFDTQQGYIYVDPALDPQAGSPEIDRTPYIYVAAAIAIPILGGLMWGISRR